MSSTAVNWKSRSGNCSVTRAHSTCTYTSRVRAAARRASIGSERVVVRIRRPHLSNPSDMLERTHSMLRQIFLTGLLMIATTLAASAADTDTKTPVTLATSETLTLGGGCFWCLEAVFTELKGVTRVESGYAGGKVPNPSYEQVSDGNTGHAEVVQITFDTNVIER